MKRNRTNTDEKAVKKVAKAMEEEKLKVVTWKVTPWTVQGTRVNAPAIYVDARKEEEAVKAAKLKSSLSRYPNWQFSARAVDERQVRRY